MNQAPPAAFLITLVVGAAAVYVACKMMSRKKKYRYVGKVSQLYVYPVKSCKGLQMNQVMCTKLGASVDGFTDRHWAISLASGSFLTQRQIPKMALIEPSFQGEFMQLKAPGMEPISFPAFQEPNDSNRSTITVWGVTLPSVDLGDEVSKWLSSFLQREGLRLHFSAPSMEKREYAKPETKRRFPFQAGDKCAFPDDAPYMILSNESIASLNTKLDNQDEWSHMQIGDTAFRALDHCTRCVLTNVDPAKGVKNEKGEPLATLQKFRIKEGYSKHPCFGMFHAVDREGVIKVGDSIYALHA